MDPEKTVIFELLFKIADIVPDQVFSLGSNYPDVLIHGFHIDYIVDLNQEFFSVFLDDYLSGAPLLVLNISDDFLELFDIDRFSQISQGVDFVAFECVFHMSRKEHNKDFFRDVPDLFCERDPVYRRHLNIQEDQIERLILISFDKSLPVRKSIDIIIDAGEKFIKDGLKLDPVSFFIVADSYAHYCYPFDYVSNSMINDLNTKTIPFTTLKTHFTPFSVPGLMPMLKSPQSIEERKSPKMKNVFKQILKALGYFAVYLLTSNLVTLAVSVFLGFTKGNEYSAAGMSREAAMQALQNEQNAMTGICLLVGAILTLLVYFIIEKVKKSSLAKETDMKKVSVKQLVLTVVGALGGMFFLNFILNLLPIPKELIGDLSSGMSKLTSYPFWQAILANAIFVPVIEEVVFRGYLFNWLGKAMPAAVAAVISSVVFGICHGGLLWAVWAFVFGMLICIVRIKSGSIIPGMIFHIIVNTFGMVVSYYPVLKNLTSGGLIALTIAGGALLTVYVVGILLDKGSHEKNKKATVVISSSKA